MRTVGHFEQGDANKRPNHAAVPVELPHQLSHRLDGNRKGHAIRGDRFHVVESYHLPIQVYERPSGVALVDCDVGLDEARACA